MLTLFLAWAGLQPMPAPAFENDVPLADPAMEDRARELSRLFRCLVCQNQSIFDSDAELALDLRRVVRERIAAGDSDEEVTDYLVVRYGDFVLLKPPFKPRTYLLWLGPALIVALAIIGVAVFFRRRSQVAAAPLSESEQARLAALLDDEPSS